jgi:hypothetical protein
MHTVLRIGAWLLLFGATAGVVSDERGGEDHPSRRRVIAYAKSLDVKKLDPSLSSERLDGFLRRALPSVPLRWVSSDCENKPPSFPRPADTPLCASVFANIGGRGLRLHIVVGTHSQPISGTPRIEKLYLIGSSRAGLETIILSSLGELEDQSQVKQ